MANFYYNSELNDSSLTQWKKYIQTQLFVIDIQSSLKTQINEYHNFIKSASMQQADAIQHSTTSICGTLERGFSQINQQLSDVNWRLNDINEGISSLHSMLDWKTDLMIEELKITNVFMGNITQLLKIPDSQKQRSYYVEHGLVYLKNAIEEGSTSDFYKEAMDEFMKAEAIEDKDFFTMFRIGLIYYSSVNYLDIKKAISYFALSARYAKAFGNALPVSTQTILNCKGGEKYEKVFTKNSLYNEASNSLVFASRCCYIFRMVTEGLSFAEEAFKIAPENAEAGFQLVKMLVAAGQNDKACDTIEKVININRYYSLKVLTDPDIIINKEIQIKLLDITAKTKREATKKYSECKATIIPNSVAISALDEVRKTISGNDFLSFKKALDLIEKVSKWTYSIYHISGCEDSCEEIISDMKISEASLSSIIRMEVCEEKRREELELEVEKYNHKHYVEMVKIWILIILIIAIPIWIIISIFS